MGKRSFPRNSNLVILVLIFIIFLTNIYGGKNVMIKDVYPNKGIYKPGEKAIITVELIVQETFRGSLALSIKDFATEIFRESYTLNLTPGKFNFFFEWTTPQGEKGFGVDAAIFDNDGKMLDTKSTALDTALSWTKVPRYGFMCDFSPNLIDSEERVKELVKFHITGVQFYDWMYRHDTYIPPQDIFKDPLGRELSLIKVREKINLSKKYGINPMAYTAIYAASKEFMENHKEWGLFRDRDLKNIYDYANGFLYIMNPSPGSPWTLHMMEEYKKIISQLNFDGIHIDQYGDPKSGYGKDLNGNIDLSEVIPEFINLTKKNISTIDPNAAVTFNCVANWPMEKVAKSREDFEYIEVWPPYRNFDDLYILVNNAKRLSGGRPVVIAAYIDTLLSLNILLSDAIIFASGGYRIELGEGKGYLVDPYFPKYKTLSDELYENLRRYYDFITRYRTFLYDSKLVVNDNVVTQEDIWVMKRILPKYDIIHLINYDRALMDRWNEPIFRGIKDKKNFVVNLKGVKEPKAVYIISPDGKNPKALSLNFTYKRNTLSISVPSLHIWDTLIIEWKEVRDK